MTHFRSFADIRRDYGSLQLSEETVASHPAEQFRLWFEEVMQNERDDPSAMVLSTVDDQGFPDSRVVLLKGIDDDGNFLFYTNYKSAKGEQILQNPHVALNFYWPCLARQVRVRGNIEPVNSQTSDEYFASRPIKSQFSAFISPQSQVIPNRLVLENAFNELMQKQGDEAIARPEYWGGYKVIPYIIEFWQGRDDRVHDRIQYTLQQHNWTVQRLAP